MKSTNLEIFTTLESNVRTYCRDVPAVFSTGLNATLVDDIGNRYTDLVSGAGSHNYGHANPLIIEPVIDYLSRGGIHQSLDYHTSAKADFLEIFNCKILAPRNLDYRIQFCGPTGTNCVEAAMKLARKITSRTHIAAFTRGYHGMTLGSLAATGSASKRKGSGVMLDGIHRLPYDGYHNPEIDTIAYIETLYRDPSSGFEPPAAFLLETVQGEGGLAACGTEWLKKLCALAAKLEALIIIDEVQTGCGRTGPFFSFETHGINPDIVCLSKSLGGGFPIAITLVKPEIDAWAPGEHNGTFRGNNLAFVAAKSIFLNYWSDSIFQNQISSLSDRIRSRLEKLCAEHSNLGGRVMGRGLMTGIAFNDSMISSLLKSSLLERHVLVETCGPKDEVLKLMPPLTIETEILDSALDALDDAVRVLPANHQESTIA